MYPTQVMETDDHWLESSHKIEFALLFAASRHVAFVHGSNLTKNAKNVSLDHLNDLNPYIVDYSSSNRLLKHYRHLVGWFQTALNIVDF